MDVDIIIPKIVIGSNLFPATSDLKLLELTRVII